jgi:hypothetical protein
VESTNIVLNKEVEMFKYSNKLDVITESLIFHGLYLKPHYKVNQDPIIACAQLKGYFYMFLNDIFSVSKEIINEEIIIYKITNNVSFEIGGANNFCLEHKFNVSHAEQEAIIFKEIRTVIEDAIDISNPKMVEMVDKLYKLCKKHYRDLETNTNFEYYVQEILK